MTYGYDAPEPPINPPEPDVAGHCAYCDADLYDGCEYVRDRNDDEWYCDDDCYVKEMHDRGVISNKEIRKERR